jgi:hypothetical protein
MAPRMRFSADGLPVGVGSFLLPIEPLAKCKIHALVVFVHLVFLPNFRKRAYLLAYNNYYLDF